MKRNKVVEMLEKVFGESVIENQVFLNGIHVSKRVVKILKIVIDFDVSVRQQSMIA